MYAVRDCMIVAIPSPKGVPAKIGEENETGGSAVLHKSRALVSGVFPN